jgi:hypothetical protein
MTPCPWPDRRRPIADRPVIPTQAGIQALSLGTAAVTGTRPWPPPWTPAFAGVTDRSSPFLPAPVGFQLDDL